MKKHLIIFFLLTLLCSCNNEFKKTEEFYRITFENGFEGEEVSFFVNSNIIFENYTLRSNKTYGATDAQFYVNKKGNEYEGYIFNKKIIIKETLIETELILNIIVNKKVNEFKIDISKGKFIGIELENENLKLIQTKEPQLYD